MAKNQSVKSTVSSKPRVAAVSGRHLALVAAQKAVSPRATISQAQADAAVRSYLRNAAK
jgi:hypothetical protein